ncbi:MAG: hypothetical protein CMJ25_12565 [Phycisphaerae bacterium]|nr:hypothetical protein [Phycisphaerae bacterium]|tara:strand:+ start:93 stop:320 length:228 start_codon:yes stop_codon:yes gene_type:complete
MFTVEHESDATVIVSLDEKNKFEDVEVIVGAGSVYIRQFDKDMDQYEMIYCSFQQLVDIMAALNSSEGMYFTRIK